MSMFLQVLGVITLAFIIATAVVFGPLVWKIWKAIRQIKKLAHTAIADMEKIYGGPHDLVEANPADFPNVDAAPYDDAARQFEALGFRTLGDIEDKTMSEANPALRTFIRVFSGVDGDVSAGFFSLASFRVFDLETEFADGVHLCVTNAEQAEGLDQPPEIMKRFYPADTPLQKLLDLHMQSVRERLAAVPGATIVKCLTLDDAIQANHRAHEIHCRFRRERGGGITGDEIRRIAGDERDSASRLLGAAVDRERRRDSERE